MYTARSQPDNRDIRITGGRITEVQLYYCSRVTIEYNSQSGSRILAITMVTAIVAEVLR